MMGLYISSFLFFINEMIAQDMQSNEYEIYQLKTNTGWEDWALDTVAFYIQKMQVIDKANCNWDNCIDNSVQLMECFYFKSDFDSLLYHLELPKKEQWLSMVSSTNSLLDNYLNMWGIYYNSLNDYRKAATIFEKLQHQDLNKKNKNYSNIVEGYTNLSNIYNNKGDYSQSIIYAKQGLFYQRDSVQQYIHINTSKLLNNQAFAFFQKNNTRQSNTLYFKALNILKEIEGSTQIQKEFIQIYQNIALNYKKQLHYDKALEWLTRAIDRQQKFNIKDDVLQSDIYRHLGEVRLLQGRYKKALDYSNRGLDLRKEVYGNQHQAVAMSYKIIADIYAQQHQAQAALNNYQNAIQALTHHLDHNQNPNLKHSISGKTDLLQILQAKAQTQQTIHQHPQALATYQTAIDLIDTLRLNYIAEGSKYLLLEKAVPIYEGAIQTAIELGKNKLAFQLAEKSKAVLLLENIKNLQAKSFAHIPETTLEQERDFKIQIAFTERQAFEAQQAADEDKSKTLQQKLFNLKYEYQVFLKEIERSYPAYYQLKYDTKVSTVEQVQRELLNEKNALVEFFVGENHIFTFVVTAKDIQVYQQAKSSDFEKNIAQLKMALKTPTGEQTVFEGFTAAAWYFYQQLMQPVVVQLNPTIEQLIIVPDGQLNYLPFQTFIRHQADGRYQEARYDTLSYLVQDFTLSYAYSSTLLLEMGKARDNKKQPVQEFGGFAPVFRGEEGQQRGTEQLASLVNSWKEVTQIDSIVNGVVFLEEAANKKTFLDRVADYRILHLATHAAVNDSFPSNSRIHFYDDFLTVGEIYNLPLSAELAVLSACETGTGRLQKGEGLMSLARAFAYSGCPSLVTSLWQVDDEQTAEVMIDFYEGLYQGQAKDVALRQAQLAYLKNSYQSYQHKHPFYWASFVIVGNVEGVFEIGAYCPCLWSLGLLMIGGLLGFWWKKKINAE